MHRCAVVAAMFGMEMRSQTSNESAVSALEMSLIKMIQAGPRMRSFFRYFARSRRSSALWALARKAPGLITVANILSAPWLGPATQPGYWKRLLFFVIYASSNERINLDSVFNFRAFERPHFRPNQTRHVEAGSASPSIALQGVCAPCRQLRSVALPARVEVPVMLGARRHQTVHPGSF